MNKHIYLKFLKLYLTTMIIRLYTTIIFPLNGIIIKNIHIYICTYFFLIKSYEKLTEYKIIFQRPF